MWTYLSDNQPYNDCQLKEIASGIRGKIRKINQREGKTPDKFLSLIDKIVERIKYVGTGLDWEEFEKDPILQQLRNMPCLSQQASQATDHHRSLSVELLDFYLKNRLSVVIVSDFSFKSLMVSLMVFIL